MNTPRYWQQGQIALITMLIMVVVLTVGLSLYSRTTLDLTSSRQEEQSSKVLQAAESGIEDALGQDLAALNFTNDTVSIPISDIGGTTGSNVNVVVTRKKTINLTIDEGNDVQVNTTGATGTSRLKITWGVGQSCGSTSTPVNNTNPAAFLIRVYNKNGATYTARNYGISVCDYSAGNQFSPALAGASFSAITGNSTTGYTTYLTLAANDVLVSLQPMYNSATVVVEGDNFTLPFQYYEITAKAENNTGSENRAVTVTRTISQYPNFLNYTLYSGTTITQ